VAAAAERLRWDLVFRSRGCIRRLACSLNKLWRPHFTFDLPWKNVPLTAEEDGDDRTATPTPPGL
jgi:hypothetical protein